MAAAKLPPATTVVRVPPTLLLAASTPWPAILVGVAVVVAVCLWLLFRSGSMAGVVFSTVNGQRSPLGA
jgi:hypothetical protein